MRFGKTKSTEKIWDNICKHEGEKFYTATNIEYDYVIQDDCLFINNDHRRKISKKKLTEALKIKNPTPSNLNLWGQSYIYGIITDSRII